MSIIKLLCILVSAPFAIARVYPEQTSTATTTLTDCETESGHSFHRSIPTVTVGTTSTHPPPIYMRNQKSLTTYTETAPPPTSTVGTVHIWTIATEYANATTVTVTESSTTTTQSLEIDMSTTFVTAFATLHSTTTAKTATSTISTQSGWLPIVFTVHTRLPQIPIREGGHETIAQGPSYSPPSKGPDPGAAPTGYHTTSPRYPELAPRDWFPDEVQCTIVYKIQITYWFIRAIISFTTTVTPSSTVHVIATVIDTSTLTRVPPLTIVTVTDVKTVTHVSTLKAATTSTIVSTTTSWASVTATASFYEACNRENILIQNQNGWVVRSDRGSNNQFAAQDAYSCCVACQNDHLCTYSAYHIDSGSPYGGLCYNYQLEMDHTCQQRGNGHAYNAYKEQPQIAYAMSNGECGYAYFGQNLPIAQQPMSIEGGGNGW